MRAGANRDHEISQGSRSLRLSNYKAEVLTGQPRCVCVRVRAPCRLALFQTNRTLGGIMVPTAGMFCSHFTISID